MKTVLSLLITLSIAFSACKAETLAECIDHATPVLRCMQEDIDASMDKMNVILETFEERCFEKFCHPLNESSEEPPGNYTLSTERLAASQNCSTVWEVEMPGCMRNHGFANFTSFNDMARNNTSHRNVSNHPLMGPMVFVSEEAETRRFLVRQCGKNASKVETCWRILVNKMTEPGFTYRFQRSAPGRGDCIPRAICENIHGPISKGCKEKAQQFGQATCLCDFEIVPKYHKCLQNSGAFPEMPNYATNQTVKNEKCKIPSDPCDPSEQGADQPYVSDK